MSRKNFMTGPCENTVFPTRITNHDYTTHDPRTCGLYIHIPFCLARCHFCAFYVQVYREDRASRFLRALHREIEQYGDRFTSQGRSLDSIYLGGGTPTALEAEQLADILSRIRNFFPLNLACEITIEAHPGTMSEEGIEKLVRAGCNRLSFGLQSVDRDELIEVGRKTEHDPIRTVVNQARRVGIRNLNLDLMYGLPGQTLEGWRRTLDEVLACEPEHLSTYALTIEDKTGLAVEVHRGDPVEPDPELQNAMEEETERRLGEAGFHHYEISNYSRPGSECRHNLHYWRGQDYLGLGPSATSFVDGCRFGNVESLPDYCAGLEAGQLPIVEWEPLTSEQIHREQLVFGLRLLDGIDAAEPESPLIYSDRRPRVAHLVQEGLLVEEAHRLKLTAKGRRYADSVALELW